MFDYQQAIKNYSMFENIRIAIYDLRYATLTSYVYVTLQIICSVLQPIVLVFIPAFVVQQLQMKAEIMTFFTQLIGLIIGVALLNVVKIISETTIQFRVNGMISSRYYAKLNQYLLNTSLEKLEDAQEQQLLKGISQSLSGNDGTGKLAGVNGLYMYTIALIINTLGFIIYAIFTSELHYSFFIILVLCSIVNCYYQHKAIQFEMNNMDAFWKNAGQFWHLKQEAREIKKAKDIRIYSLQYWFKKALQKNYEESISTYGIIQKKYRTSAFITATSALVRDIYAYTFLIIQLQNNTIDLAQFVLFVGVVAGFGMWINKIIESYSLLNKITQGLSLFRTFLDSVPSQDALVTIKQETCESIVFDQVSFSYATKQVFSDFSCQINQGEKIALVGVNGCGKSTLVKLLCGLYTPQHGSVLFNMQDIKQYNKESYYALFSILFQDIHVLPFTIAENIACASVLHSPPLQPLFERGYKGISTKERISNTFDEAKVIACLKQANLWDKVSSLPQGIYTPLTKVMEHDGIQLSGGQTQRLMLARALYKDAPVLILDEPTSALDPIAESELYEEYARLCEDKTSIFISHRLSSTRFCDRILFLEEGKIVEEGSHEQLMALQGKYAQMYEIQAHYYQKEAMKDEAGI